MQTITSAATSRNHIPAIMRLVDRFIGWREDTINLDICGGKYDKFKEALRSQHNVINRVIDPFNRSPEHNEKIRDWIRKGHKVDTVTLSNVLNVISQTCDRQSVIKEALFSVCSGGQIYITVYEGNKSGFHKRTRDGMQLNRRLATYTRELESLPLRANVLQIHGMIIITKW